MMQRGTRNMVFFSLATTHSAKFKCSLCQRQRGESIMRGNFSLGHSDYFGQWLRKAYWGLKTKLKLERWEELSYAKGCGNNMSWKISKYNCHKLLHRDCITCSSVFCKLLYHFPFSGHSGRLCIPAYFIIRMRSCDWVLTNGLCSISRAGEPPPPSFSMAIMNPCVDGMMSQKGSSLDLWVTSQRRVYQALIWVINNNFSKPLLFGGYLLPQHILSYFG